jgi:hypothetical protein
MTEAHAEDRIEVYVLHFRACFVEGGVAGDCGAVFEGSDHQFDIIGFDPFGDEEAKRLNGGQRSDGRQPMLIPLRKLVKFPKGVSGRPLRFSVVRLQLFDDLTGVRGYTLESICSFVFKTFRAVKDREHQTFFKVRSQRTAVVGNSKFVNEVIKG